MRTANLLGLLASLAFILATQTEYSLLFFIVVGVLLMLAAAIWYREIRLTNPPNMRMYMVSMGFLFLSAFTFTLAWLAEQPLLFVVAGLALIVAFVTYRRFRLDNSNSSME